MRRSGLSPEALELIQTAREEEASATSESRERSRRSVLSRIARIAPGGLLGVKVLTVSTPVAAALPAWLAPLKVAALVLSGVVIGTAASKGAELVPALSDALRARSAPFLAAKSAKVEHPPPLTSLGHFESLGVAQPEAASSSSNRAPLGSAPSTTGAAVNQRRQPLPEEAPRAAAATDAATALAAPEAAAPDDRPQFRQELDVLQAVHRAVQAGQGRQALQLIHDYDARFAGGQLMSERVAAEVFAACLVGDIARARQAQLRFLSHDTVSPLAMRVKAVACVAAPLSSHGSNE